LLGIKKACVVSNAGLFNFLLFALEQTPGYQLEFKPLRLEPAI